MGLKHTTGSGLSAVARRLVDLSAAGLPRGPHITRFAMYRHLQQLAEAYGFSGSSRTLTLSVSGSRALCEVLQLGESRIVEAAFPMYDLRSLAFGSDVFNYVVSDQVLEHVEGNVFSAVEESFRVVRPGGWVIHTTCFINPIHLAPGDFWRFTADGLRVLCEPYGEVVEAGGWGNRHVWTVERLGLRRTPVPTARWHPLYRVATRNESKWRVVTWVLARKQ